MQSALCQANLERVDGGQVFLGILSSADAEEGDQSADDSRSFHLDCNNMQKSQISAALPSVCA